MKLSVLTHGKFHARPKAEREQDESAAADESKQALSINIYKIFFVSHKTDIKHLKHGLTVVKHSILLLVVLTLIKAFGGYITNMVVLIGDAAGSFMDLIAQIAIFIGLTLSLRPPDKRFKYGYHRIETLISLLISIFIIYVGYTILIESIARLRNPAVTQFAAVGIVTAIISIIVSLIAYHFHKKTAQEINSSALMTSAIDKRNDAFVSGGVLIGIIANALDIPYVENSIGVLVAIVVLLLGLNTAKDSLLYLLDYWDDPALSKRINQILNTSKLIIGIKNIRLRHVGTFIFGEAFIEINPFADMIDVRDELHHLNTEITKRIPHLGDFVLYIDPPKPNKIRIALPITEDHGVKSTIAENLNEPFYFMILEVLDKKIQHIETYADQKFTSNQSALLSLFLKRHNVNILIANDIQALLFFTLRLAHIKIYPHFGNVKDVEHTIKLLLLDI